MACASTTWLSEQDLAGVSYPSGPGPMRRLRILRAGSRDSADNTAQLGYSVVEQTANSAWVCVCIICVFLEVTCSDVVLRRGYVVH